MPSNHILMVDNSTATSKILSRLIEKKIDDCFVTTCKTTKEAFDLLKKKNFNLITSSLVLPDVNGLEFAVQVRNNKAYKKTPFIIVSGDADATLMNHGFEIGVTGYFDKCLGYNALISYIESLLPVKEVVKAKVLYVEDSKTAALQVNRILKAHGYKIYHTDSAEGAIELLSEGSPDVGPAFDLVVVDITLNGQLNGLDLVKNIRGRLHFSAAALPVLISSSDNSNMEKVFECGANDFISKPIHEELFCIRLKGLLAVRDQEKYKAIEDTIKNLFKTSPLASTPCPS